MVDLPESWVAIALSDAVINITITDKKIPQKEYVSEGSYPVFDQGQDYIGGYSNKKEKLVDCELPVIVFGDHTRVIKFVNQPFAPGADGIKVLQPQYFYHPRLLEYFARHIVTYLTNHGYARHYQHLAKSIIPLPPLPEQHHIVAKIEELFSELDKGIENLKTARAQLKVYRQALLKHAFEGKLTAQWRAENQDKLETAEVLQKRIQLERAHRYQQQLADWEKSKSPSVPLLQRGKTTSTATSSTVPPFEKGGLGGISEHPLLQKGGRGDLKPKAPKHLPLLTAEELAELPELPKGWFGARLGWMTCSVEYGTSAKSAETGACPVLRMGNIQNGKFDWSDLVFTDDEVEIAKYLLREGDVLFNRTNSPELVGKSAIFKSKFPTIFAGYLIRINQIKTIVVSQYLNYFLNSHIAKQHGNTVKTDGVNQSNINGEKLVNYPFPFCSLEEQKVIVELLDAKLSEVDQLELTIITSLQQAEALRQSILKKAFSGQLVPQDPHDEPASALLARIKAARAVGAKNALTAAKPRKTAVIQ